MTPTWVNACCLPVARPEVIATHRAPFPRDWRVRVRENTMREFRIAAIAAAMLTAAVAPGFAQPATGSATTQQPQTGTPTTGTPATQPGAVSDDLVHKVGAALRQTVTIRQKYTQRAQAANTPEQKQALSRQVETEMMR